MQGYIIPSAPFNFLDKSETETSSVIIIATFNSVNNSSTVMYPSAELFYLNQVALLADFIHILAIYNHTMMP